MKIITKHIRGGGSMRWYSGNVLKELLKQPMYKKQENPAFIKNILTGEFIHYNKMMNKTLISQF